MFWFRRDLRLEDNHGLFQALSNSSVPVLPVFIFDSEILKQLESPFDARVTFIYQMLVKIDQKLRSLGSGLLVLYGQPQKVFEKLIHELNIRALYTNRDYEPYAVERDEKVKNLLFQFGVKFFSYKDQVIFEKSEVAKNDGSPYTVFTPYSRQWMKILDKNVHLKSFSSEKKKENFWKVRVPPILSLEEIGFKYLKREFPDSRIQSSLLQNYKRDRDFPWKDATTHLGVHLRFGTVSPRKAIRKGLSTSKVWVQELIWREFFQMILFYFPHTVDQPFRAAYSRIPWRKSRKDFQRWCEGTTGFPLIDAGMRELNETGYMHNRVRMLTASFLTKHLLIDWRWGERYFAKKLLDFELASNVGNWQWAAGCGTDAAPYFRVFNPDTQLEKFDKQLEYVKHWVPETGTSAYPKPMVGHKWARERALKTFKSVLESYKRGGS